MPARPILIGISVSAYFHSLDRENLMCFRLALVLTLTLMGLSATPAAAQTKDDIPVLLRLLKNASSNERTKAAQDLGKIGPDAKEAIGPLGEALKVAPFSNERVAMVEAIVKVGANSHTEAVAAVLGGLKTVTFAEETVATVNAFKSLKAEAKEVVPALTAALSTVKASGGRVALADYLGTFGPDAKDAVPALIEGLKWPFAEDRAAAGRALGQMGSAAKTALDPLLDAVEKSTSDVEREAFKAAYKKIKMAG
jgi:HEAT repeat protein